MSDSIVVTGFGPFFGHTINASWEAVRLLPDKINGITIIKKEIPVQYSHIQTKIPQLWEKHKPLLVIHVGVSGEAKKITLEKCAKRDGYQRIDVTGATHSTGRACDSGEECIYTGINVADVCDKLNNSGKLNACMSSNAGRYLCEFIYYTSLNIDPSKVLFIHVPPLDNPYTAEELSEGLLDIIEHALEQLYSQKEKNLSTNII